MECGRFCAFASARGLESETPMSVTTIVSLRDLEAWQAAMDLAVTAHGLAAALPPVHRFELGSQMASSSELGAEQHRRRPWKHEHASVFAPRANCDRLARRTRHSRRTHAPTCVDEREPDRTYSVSIRSNPTAVAWVATGLETSRCGRHSLCPVDSDHCRHRCVGDWSSLISRGRAEPPDPRPRPPDPGSRNPAPNYSPKAANARLSSSCLR